MDDVAARPWKVPGYLLLHRLGGGADATVWQATVRRTGAAVAVKLVAADRERREAARREAATLATLDHPHLVRLHDTVTCPEGLALILDLAGGGSLRDVLAARGRLAVGEVVTALAPIGAALAYAHNRGVLHGDVSAANVLFTDAGLPLLADLGLARLHGDAGTAMIRCTPAYMDPVVAAGGVPTRESDVFMLAAVALHALTGEPVWRAPDAATATALAAAGDLADLPARLRRAAAPESLARVVAAGLSADPGARPSAAEFALDLRHAATPVAVGLRAGRARHRAGEPMGQNALMTYGRRVPAPELPPARRWSGRLRAVPVGFRRPGPPGGAPRRSWKARRVAGIGAVGAVGAVVVAGGLWFGLGSGPSAPRSASPPARLDSAGARAVLANLDATRARAYAGRDPALLSRVYASAELRAQDAAQLGSLVPAGCGLLGVHTDYRDVTVTSSGSDGVTVRVRASQDAATLRCQDRPAGHTAPGPDRRLRLVLQRSGDSYLIAELAAA